MSEPRDAAGQSAAPADGEPPVTAPVVPATPRWRELALGLAGVLLLIVVLIASAPFWAPLLPWGARDDAAALGGRIDRLADAQQQAQKEAAAVGEAVQRLDRRIGALGARPATSAADIGDIREQQAKIFGAVADLTTRVAALDKAIHAAGAPDATDTALVLLLLRVREAVMAGRPFAAEYQALIALAGARPDIASAAAPLAEPAKTGLASRAVLAKGLRDLSATVAAGTETAGAAPQGGGWGDAVLARLRGLVRIRRLDAAGSGSGPEAAVNAAELALAGGDLAGAADALDKLTGAAAVAAQPWLRMAKARLVVEAALQRIETLAASRLGAAAAAPGSPR